MKHALLLAVLLVGCKAKDKAQDKPTEEKPDPKAAAAPDAGKAATPIAALDAAPAAPASDAGAVAVAAADAGPPAADAMPAKHAEAGAFYLLNEGPLDTELVVEEVRGKVATEGGEFSMGDDEYGARPFMVARRFTTPAAEHTALVGTRLALWGIDGRKCAATVKDIVAVGTGSVRDELAERHGEPKDTADLVEKLAATTYDWYAAAILTDVEGSCADALFAIADGAKPKLVKVKAAKDWEDAAESAYEETGRVRDADAKQQLEGGPGVRMVSVRKLVAASGPSLALVYASLNDRRTIGVFAVPGPTFEGAKYLGSVDAEAPSEVVGGDFDGDGLLDVVIDSLSGTAAILGNGDGQTIMDDVVGQPWD